MSTTTATTSLPSRHDPNVVNQQQGTSSISDNEQQPPPIPPSLPPPPLTASHGFIKTVHPRDDLLVGSREDYINTCVPLYQASINGDWEAANRILERRELVRFSITEHKDTALHIAASSQSIEFLEKLVNLMEKEDLELRNESSNTAFCNAAAAGNTKMLEIMVNKYRGLLTIPGGQRMMPLDVAALFGHRDAVKYLYDNSHKMKDDLWTPKLRGQVLLKCIEANLFDIALRILEDCPELAPTEGVLRVLARKPYAFNDIKPHFSQRIINWILAVAQARTPGSSENESEAMKLLKIIWTNIMKMPKVEIDELLRGPRDEITRHGKQGLSSKYERAKYSSRILFIAAEMGNIKFVVEIIRQYPDLIWKVNDDNQSIFHIAVAHRHESIYNLLYEIGPMKDLIIQVKDPAENNILHLVGKMAKKNRLPNVSGVTFQMQRELLWFKEVEAMIPPSFGEMRNADGLTPHELFTMEHTELVSKGEEWMKGTANQCMVVAALIATIVFAVAFSIPGGYDQNNGRPTFLRKEIFIAFVISDAISLIFSSASILMFLSILTSRYAEEDFLESLPQKLMIGLATLFLSIMTMMIAFSFSFFVLYHNNLIWVPIVINVVAVVPVVLYAKLQYPLLMDVYRSIYGSRYIFKPKKHMLYYKNPKF